MKQHNKQFGFSLIEVLVTLLVLSIGLLGLAGLQGQSLRANNKAFERSAVTALANEIINRMQLNRTAMVDTFAYDNTGGTLAVENTACNADGECPAADVAGHDLFVWDTNLAALLENGAGVVCRDTSPNDGIGPSNADNACSGDGNVYAIKIWWGTAGAANQSFFVTSLQ